MNIKTYTTLGGKDLILEFLDSLPRKEMLEGYAIMKHIQKKGLDGLITRQLNRKLWEIKFYRHNRIYYVVLEREHIFLLHACKKQKGKAEKFELETAIQRMKDI